VGLNSSCAKELAFLLAFFGLSNEKTYFVKALGETFDSLLRTSKINNLSVA
jgi:hypothetical protein